MHGQQAAEAAFFDEIARRVEPGVGPVLEPALDDPLGARDDSGKGTALGHAVRERLLDIGVLAGHARRGGDQAMEVVGRRDDDGVNVLALEHAAVVLLDGQVAALGGGLPGAGEVGVAGQHQPRLVAQRHRLLHAPEQGVAPAAAPDQGEADLRVHIHPPAHGNGSGRRRWRCRQGQPGQGNCGGS